MGQAALKQYHLEIVQNYHLTFAYCILDLTKAYNVSISSLFTLESVL